MKVCTKCNIEKDEDEFYKNRSYCKKCIAEYKRSYHVKNRERILQKHKEYYAEHSDEIINRSKVYYENNKEKKHIYDKERNIRNKEKIRLYGQKYYIEHKKECIERGRKLTNKKYKSDSLFKLRVRLSCEIKRALRKNNSSKKGHSILEYLPYSIQELKNHLESLFEPWMNWNNHGKYVNIWDDNDQSTWVWNIDHIIPQSDLRYTSMEDDNFKKCWSLDNLRPLSAKQNIIEGTNRIRHKK